MSRRGFTVLELLVALGLLSLVVTLMVGFVIPELERTTASAERAALQSEAALCVEQIIRELQTSSAEGVSLAPHAIGMVPIVDVTSLGTLVWGSEMHIFFFHEDRVLRRVVDAGLDFSLSRPPRLAEAELQALCEPEGAKLVASRVESFEILDPLEFRVVTEQRGHRFRYSRRVSYRNR